MLTIPQTNAWLTIPDAFTASVIARTGFDSITLDMQHGQYDEAAVVRTLSALPSTQPKIFVRVPRNEPSIIEKVLDFGADGVIVPMINNAAEADALVQAAHYPPAGQRSYGPMQAVLRAGDRPYLHFAASVEVFAMIETAQALASVREIAETQGISGVFVGPSDLALSLGYQPGADREEDRIIDALGSIVGAANAAGKRAGLYCQSPAYARRMADMGFDFLTIATDTALLATGALAARAAFNNQSDRH